MGHKIISLIRYYCYHTSPIDFWDGALSVEQYLDRCDVDNLGLPPEVDARSETRDDVDRLIAQALQTFRDCLNWAGDGGPSLFTVPIGVGGYIRFAPGVCVKQSQGGHSFIASPIPLDFEKTNDCYDGPVYMLTDDVG